MQLAHAQTFQDSKTYTILGAWLIIVIIIFASGLLVSL